jgi:RNA polymerase sigma factor (TIGR02999 family)
MNDSPGSQAYPMAQAISLAGASPCPLARSHEGEFLHCVRGPIRLVYERNLDVRGNVSDATVMLAAVERGDPKAAQELLVLVYDELRRIAAFKMAHESPGQTLQPTALVHEAWMRLVGNETPTFNNRAHFFHTASEAMRRILIDRARRKRTERHGGGYLRVELEGFDPAAPDADDQLLAVHEAVDKLALEHPVQAQLVKLKYFAGMTNEEVSEVMGISVATVKNYWTFSRAWLLDEIDEN